MSPQKISSKEILAIKISAEYSELNKYIYIVLFIDKYHSKLIDIAFVISDDHKLLRFLESYTNFLEMYKHIKIYNKLNSYRKTILFEKFQKVLDDIFSDEKNINNMIIYQSNNNIISIIDIFSSSLNRFMDFHIGTFDLASTLLDFDEVYAGLESIHKELENASSAPVVYNDSSSSSDQKTETQKEGDKSWPKDKALGRKVITDLQCSHFPTSGKNPDVYG